VLFCKEIIISKKTNINTIDLPDKMGYTVGMLTLAARIIRKPVFYMVPPCRETPAVQRCPGLRLN
jgi:hypothetical protein